MDSTLRPPSLLVATPQLQDPVFQQSVILLVEHNHDGAYGFIVNRPEANPLAHMIDSEGLDIPETIPTWFGGPVGANAGLILHCQQAAFAAGDQELSDRMFLSFSKSSIQKLVEDETKRHSAIEKNEPQVFDVSSDDPLKQVLYPYRFIVGYAGWSQGQLDEEIRFGGWMQLPLDRHLLFCTPWTKMWDSSLATIGVSPMNFVAGVQPYLN